MKSLPEIIRIIIKDTSPPLWNICEWIVFNTFGTSEIYIRGLAFFFFLITIFFVYKIGSFLWDKKTGLIAAALAFLNPFFFTYAFEGRMYSIMAAGVAGSMYFFLRLSNFLQTKDRGKKNSEQTMFHLFGYILMTLWALYSHHFAIFAVIVQGLWFLYFLIAQRHSVLPVMIGFVGVALGYTPWLMPLYNQTKMVGGGFWLGKPKFVDLIALILEYLAYGIKHILGFPALILVLSLLGLRRWSEGIKKSLFLLTWFLGPILFAWIISQVFTSVFYNRYLLYTIPAAMLLVASNHRKFSMMIIGLTLLLFAIIDVHYFTHPIKLRFDELALFVKSTKGSNDYLINWNDGAHHLWETKYYGIPAPIYIDGDGELPYFVGTALMGPNDTTREIPAGTKRVGVVTSGDLEKVSLPGFEESERIMFDRLKFAWFTRTNPQ